MRALFWVLLLLFLITNTKASTYVWNNATAGSWTDTRWLIDGAGPLVCCPTLTDDAIIQAQGVGDFYYYVMTDDGVQVSSLEVGPTPIGTIVFIFYGPSLPFKAHSHISIYENAYLRVIGELVIPPGKNATFKELSFLWITNSYIGCEVVGECLLNLDQGTIVAYNNGNPSRADFVGLNFRLFQSSYQNTLNSQSQLVFWSCNVDMSVADIRLVSGRYKFITSNHTMDYCNLKLSKDPTQYTYIAWTEGSVATIANTDVGSIGRPLVADSSEVTFDGEGPYAAFTLSDGATLYSQTGSIVTLQRFAKIEMNRGYIMDSTLSSLYLINSVSNTSYLSVSSGGFFWVSNSSIEFQNTSALSIKQSGAIITGIMSFDGTSFCMVHNSSMIVESMSVGYYFDSQNSTVLITSHFLAKSSRIDAFESTLIIDGDFVTQSTTAVVVQFGSLTVNGAFLLLDSYMQSAYSSFRLNGGFEFGNCTPADVTWNLEEISTDHLSCAILFQASEMEIQGNMILAANSSTRLLKGFLNLAGKLSAGSGSLIRSVTNTVRVSGAMDLADMHFASNNDTITLEGGLLVANCTSAPPELFNDKTGAINITVHRSCVTLFEDGSFFSNGNIHFGKNSSTIFNLETARVNGTMLVESFSFALIRSAQFEVLGELIVGVWAKFYSWYSDLSLTSGRVRFQQEAYIGFSRTNVDIRGSELILEPGALIMASRSRVVISAGQVYLHGDDLATETELSGLLSHSQSEVVVSGGQIFVDRAAVFGAIGNGSLFVNGGSLLVESLGSIQANQNSTVEISAGIIDLNYGTFLLGGRSLVRVLGGDIRLRNFSTLSLKSESKLVVEGSIYLLSSKIALTTSVLQISNGSIYMDEKSIVRLHSSSITGVGSINGSVELLDSKITYAESASTQLTVGSLIQSNDSIVEVNISSNYTSGTSTSIHSHQGVYVTGTLLLAVDPSIGARLRQSEAITLISSDFYVSGGFISINITGEADLTCGISLNSTAKSLAVIFDASRCLTASPTPSQAQIDSSINVAGLVVGLIVAAIVVAAIVTVAAVPKFRNVVMPWGQHKNESSMSKQEAIDSTETELIGRPKGQWQRGEVKQ